MAYIKDADAREAANKYQREWRKRNPEKVRAMRERYWIKKASTNKGLNDGK